MRKVKYELLLPVSVQKVWDFHNSPEALQNLTPPDQHFTLLDGDPTPKENSILTFQVRPFFFPISWKGRVFNVHPPFEFSDEALSGPFKKWEHRHRFIEKGPTETLLSDELSYEVRFGLLGSVADRLFVARTIDKLFAYRHRVTLESLSNHVE